jgi:D-alanine-D-alanine ligase
MLELNTIPGLTTESLIPQQAAAAKSLEDLFTMPLNYHFEIKKML